MVWEKAVNALGADRVLLDHESREKLSKDYYWYSPILKEQLDSMIADAIIVPQSEQEVIAAIRFAVEHQIPLTVRGAGTGNYGQAMPLQGGIVLDMSQLNQVLEIGTENVRVQAGIRMGLLERNLRSEGLELCVYPSTFMKSTAAGFVCGGSGGIGSVEWGFLWEGNVLEVTVLTVEENPRRLTVRGKEELLNYIHGYGTTGIVTEVTMRITQRTEWTQMMAFFNRTEDALNCCNALAHDAKVRKRLISHAEWPIPSFYLPLEKWIEPEKELVLLEVRDADLPLVETCIEAYQGKTGHRIPSASYHKGISFSDYTWNHATLWGMKADPKLTYLQCSFDPETYLDQVRQIKDRYGDDFLHHFEFLRFHGEVIPQAIPLIRFKSKEELVELVNYLESIGVRNFDPHTFILEDGGWTEQIDRVIAVKRENDPYGLLNPGKIGKWK